MTIGGRLMPALLPRTAIQFVFVAATLAGVCVGLLVALAAGRLVAGFLYGIKPYDPLSLAIGVGAVTVAALLACYLPARRAAKVDPIVTLRYE
jgi:ABC-type antimicrobial peptide transport system permease subunit